MNYNCLTRDKRLERLEGERDVRGPEEVGRTGCRGSILDIVPACHHEFVSDCYMVTFRRGNICQCYIVSYNDNK